MKSGYKAVLLDADDTIFDFARSERTALYYALQECGIKCSEEIYRTYSVINLALWRKLERGEIGKDRLRVLRFEQLAERFSLPLDAPRLNTAYGEALAACHFLLPGARSFLESAHCYCALYLTTNGIAQVQRRRIADAGIGELLDGVFISEELGANKPDARYYDAVFAALPGLSRADCIAFGDSLTSDIAGAVCAGVDSCWFNPRGLPCTAVVPPTFTVRTYTEFLELIGEKLCI